MISLSERQRRLLCILGAIPFLQVFPHTLSAWRSSPSDRMDWLFVLVFMLALACIAVCVWDAWPKRAWSPIIALVVFCAGGVLFKVKDIHALAFLCAIAIWWAWCWNVMGWQQAFSLIPVFSILALATTGSTYWLSVFLGISIRWAFATKCILTAVLFVIAIYLGVTHICFPQRTSLFIGVLFCSLCLLGMVSSTTRTYAPLKLNIPAMMRANLGIELDPTASAKQFFQTSDAKYFRFAEGFNNFELLHIQCGTDIHEIHPAGHCLKVSGWTIKSEQLREIKSAGNTFSVTELLAERGGMTMLVWVWYSSGNFSTGNFLCFRRSWHPHETWETNQLSILNPSPKDGFAEARNKLTAMVMTGK